MKKGFTLVELMVVVAVLVILMSVTFRLAGVGSDSEARNRTVNRLQRLENCLSGYYAAYGSYPPVKMHGDRNYKLEADVHGLQCDREWSGSLKDVDSGTSGSDVILRSVLAACRAQPIGMTYPFNKKSAKDFVETLRGMLMEAHPENPLYNFEALIEPSMIGDAARGKSDWRDTQVFKFGLLSFLLPRYLLVMGGDTDNSDFFTKFEQWKANNQLPPRFTDGVPFENWEKVNAALEESSDGEIEPWMIAALPSQATCARWISNLDGQLSTLQKTELYGVDVRDYDSAGTSPLEVYPADGSAESNSQQFFPDRITALDGWGSEFFYYSPPPHQSYRLWSSGKNGKTFPPWLTEEELGALSKDDRTAVENWIADDIVQMSN